MFASTKTVKNGTELTTEPALSTSIHAYLHTYMHACIHIYSCMVYMHSYNVRAYVNINIGLVMECEAMNILHPAATSFVMQSDCFSWNSRVLYRISSTRQVLSMPGRQMDGQMDGHIDTGRQKNRKTHMHRQIDRLTNTWAQTCRNTANSYTGTKKCRLLQWLHPGLDHSILYNFIYTKR